MRTDSGARQSWKVGDELTVFYDPEKPTYARTDSYYRFHGFPLMLEACGGIGLLFGLLFIILSLR